jgi:hypothetical protein
MRNISSVWKFDVSFTQHYTLFPWFLHQPTLATTASRRVLANYFRRLSNSSCPPVRLNAMLMVYIFSWVVLDESLRAF